MDSETFDTQLNMKFDAYNKGFEAGKDHIQPSQETMRIFADIIKKNESLQGKLDELTISVDQIRIQNDAMYRKFNEATVLLGFIKYAGIFFITILTLWGLIKTNILKQ